MRTHQSITNQIKDDLSIFVSPYYVGKLRRKILKLKRKRVAHVARQRKSVRIQLLRASFRRTIKLLPLEHMIFVDESNLNYCDMTSGINSNFR